MPTNRDLQHEEETGQIVTKLYDAGASDAELLSLADYLQRCWDEGYSQVMLIEAIRERVLWNRAQAQLNTGKG